MEPGIYYRKEDEKTILKMVGEVRFDQSQVIYDLIEKLGNEKSLSLLVLDLFEIDFFDSTILGAIIELGNLFVKKGKGQPLILCNDKDVKRRLTLMGVGNIYNITRQGCNDQGEFKRLTSNADKSALKQDVIKAHEALMNVDEKNKQEFADVVKALKKGDGKDGKKGK